MQPCERNAHCLVRRSPHPGTANHSDVVAQTSSLTVISSAFMNSNIAAPVRQYHKGNVVEDLKLAALRLLESERVEDLSMRRLTREVGVTPANFYNHFDSLDELLIALGADAFRERARYMAHIKRTSKTRAEAIQRLALSYLDLALARPQMFRIMFGLLPEAQKNPDFRDASDDSMGEIVEIV